jgi:GMP synthase-like glutamine amidotransferase
MRALIINNGTIRLEELEELLKSQACKVQVIQRNQIPNIDVEMFDLVVLSGSSINSVKGNEDLYKDEIDLILGSGIPIIGVCLGFQLIAYAFGAELYKRSRKRKGIIRIQVLNSTGIFRGLPNFKVYNSHKWVVKELPSELVPLARSRDGIEAFKHKHRSIYGFQFHPEMFREKSCGDEIFKNVMNCIP